MRAEGRGESEKSAIHGARALDERKVTIRASTVGRDETVIGESIRNQQ